MTTTVPTQRVHPPEPDEDGIIRYTAAQWEAEIQETLDRLGLTREELAKQAEDDEFQSYEARSLWFDIG